MIKTKLLTILLLTMLLITGCDIGYVNNPQPEPPPPKEYEVLSVIPYIEVDTNGYGAVLSKTLDMLSHTLMKMAFCTTILFIIQNMEYGKYVLVKKINTL